METYLTDNKIEYKIIGINNSYKFVLNDVTFIYYIAGCYNYHHLTMYIPPEIFEKTFQMLEEIISLIGVIEDMNIYKYKGCYETFYDIINILNIIQFGKKYQKNING